MRILACSYAFYPSVGGIETVTQLLCREWIRMGHQVSIVTHTEGDSVWEGIKVYRRPNPIQLAALIRGCDIFWQNNITLNYLFPLILAPRPWFTTAQLWPSLTTRRWYPSTVIKHLVQLFTHNIYISNAVRRHHLWPGSVIPNPVDHDRWRLSAGISKDADVVFVGRLVEGKGCALLIDAVALLCSQGICPAVTIIGDGPQMPDLERLVQDYKISKLISFTGTLRGNSLIQEVSRHRLAVIPSIWEEPFGVVVLEAIAAGCIPLVSTMGGLPEAAGPCGVAITSLTTIGLAETISSVLFNYEEAKKTLDHYSPDHLRRHSVSRIAKVYLQHFMSACRR
jgi:glycogen(starch) synthase